MLDLVVNKRCTCMSDSSRLCLTVPPVRYTDDRCTQQASGMACDSDVMEKLSRRWRGAVQQLADVV